MRQNLTYKEALFHFSLNANQSNDDELQAEVLELGKMDTITPAIANNQTKTY